LTTKVFINPHPAVVLASGLLAILFIAMYQYLERNHMWVLERFEKVVRATSFVCVRILFMYILIMVCGYLFLGMVTIF